VSEMMPILNVTDVYPSLARLYVYRARRISSRRMGIASTRANR
jgi:hypothetical protein